MGTKRNAKITAAMSLAPLGTILTVNKSGFIYVSPRDASITASSGRDYWIASAGSPAKFKHLEDSNGKLVSVKPFKGDGWKRHAYSC